MSTSKKRHRISIKRRIKVPNITIKKKFQDLIQTSLANIYSELESEGHSILNIFRQNDTELLEKIRTKFFNNVSFLSDEINSINYSSAVKTKNNELGIILSAYILSNNNNNYYRQFNASSTNILKACFNYLSGGEFAKKNHEFDIWLNTYKGLEEDKKDSLKSLINNFTVNLDTNDKKNLQLITKILSDFTGRTIVIRNHEIDKASLIPWIFDESLKDNIEKKDLQMIYLRLNTKKVFFEPIITINLTNNSVSNAISKNDVHQHQFIVNLINPQVLSPKNLKVYSSEKVFVNPYDKQADLPSIEIQLSDGQKESYLLGHKYNNFRNIYHKDKTHNLAGKVIVNDALKTVKVFWCKK